MIADTISVRKKFSNIEQDEWKFEDGIMLNHKRWFWVGFNDQQKKKKIDDGIIDKGTKSLWNNFGQRVQRSSVSQKKKCCRDAMENLKLNLSNHIFLYSFSLKIRFSLFYIFRLLFFPSNHFHNFFNFDASSLTRRISVHSRHSYFCFVFIDSIVFLLHTTTWKMLLKTWKMLFKASSIKH